MPIHFHFLIRIKAEKDLEIFFTTELFKAENKKNLISFRFSNFFNAYAKAFNKMYERKGSLFMHAFKRKKVADVTYLKNLVQYIHSNPLEGGLCDQVDQWKYSSYKLLSLPEDARNPGNFPVLKNEVISLFGDQENFKERSFKRTRLRPQETLKV